MAPGKERRNDGPKEEDLGPCHRDELYKIAAQGQLGCVRVSPRNQESLSTGVELQKPATHFCVIGAFRSRSNEALDPRKFVLRSPLGFARHVFWGSRAGFGVGADTKTSARLATFASRSGRGIRIGAHIHMGVDASQTKAVPAYATGQPREPSTGT